MLRNQWIISGVFWLNVAGMAAAFAWDDWFTESIEESNFSNIIDLLINCTTVR